ncbi:MAG TPA: PHP domain-containing protein [Mesotoga sp.]|jgi:predicted metal-dependent phosphoesterase TrpH|nr:PHP domain-containing protein [Mesotoga sp.]NLI06976.1 PHP domain-containing protein [Thermotogaceae bacterium]HOI35153.1 PHP domain-containing protein [Mesotoga infera]HON27574.1 PHP domain-containing protein [Mesotoga infera]HRV00259.1 PHP domain-containing protein [Mesotoga sp.]
MLVDLHCHSDRSDGTDPVRSLVNKACEKGIKILSVTDHDTVAAQNDARVLAESKGMTYVSGLEISCDYHETLDILGYGYDLDLDYLEKTLSRLRDMRDDRNGQILRKLRELGISLDERELEENFPGESLGRPHIANLLTKKGYVSSMEEAFRLYIGRGAAAFVEKGKLEIGRSIELIISGGGVPVLAHPISLKLDLHELKDMIRKLKNLGLEGIEVFYKEYDQDLKKELLTIAREMDLIPTGGSDYHGEHKAHLDLGIELPDELASNFLEYLNRRRRPSR